MSKKSSKNTFDNFVKKPEIPEPIVPDSVIPVVSGELMTLNKYLSKYNSQRVLDNILRKWYYKRNNLNPKKTRMEWDEIIKSFHNETEV